MKRFGLVVAAAAFSAAVVPAIARDPAVSVLNFKATVEAGQVEGEGAWLGLGQVTAPINSDWGVQGEIGSMYVNGDTLFGLAGHAFTRDPDRFLAGVFGAYGHESDFSVNLGRIGVEGEYYLEHLTLTANAGYQFGDNSFIKDTAFGEVAASWYASDDFDISGGVAFSKDLAVGHLGAEWQVGRGTSLNGLALRADIYHGDNDYDSTMGGITYYFGPDASLKDRHRRQDPDSALLDLLHGVEAGCSAQTPVLQFGAVAPKIALPLAPTACGEQVYVLPPN